MPTAAAKLLCVRQQYALIKRLHTARQQGIKSSRMKLPFFVFKTHPGVACRSQLQCINDVRLHNCQSTTGGTRGRRQNFDRVEKIMPFHFPTHYMMVILRPLPRSLSIRLRGTGSTACIPMCTLYVISRFQWFERRVRVLF